MKIKRRKCTMVFLKKHREFFSMSRFVLPRLTGTNIWHSSTPIKQLIRSNTFKQSSLRFPRQHIQLTSFNSSIRTFSTNASLKNTWNNYRNHYRQNQFKKLTGPAIFTLLFCTGTTFLVPYLFDHTPLSVLKRNPKTIVYGIIALNGIVFLLWKNLRFLKPLTKYGLLVKDNVYSNWSLLGAAFSHQDFMHLFVNMFVLQSFGATLCGIVGAPYFLVLYLNSAVISSFVLILIPTLARTSLAVGSLGASGAVFSVVGAFSYLIPKAAIAFFFIPIPGGAWFAFIASVGFNLAGLVSRWGAYDYAAHLGGSLAGVVYGYLISQKIKQKRQRARYF